MSVQKYGLLGGMLLGSFVLVAACGTASPQPATGSVPSKVDAGVTNSLPFAPPELQRDGSGIAPADRAAAQTRSVAPAPGRPVPARPPSAPGPDASEIDMKAAVGESLNDPDRMIVKTASLLLSVRDVDSALASARAIASRLGGYVAASATRAERLDDQVRTIAMLTLRIPAARYEDAMAELRSLALVVESENSGSRDVTEEVVDLDSSMRNLRATEAATLRLLDRAQRMDEILTLTRELGQIRGQIERLEGRRRNLTRQADESTIVVTVQLPPLPSPKSVAWDPLAAPNAGWQASLRFLRAAIETALLVVGFGWWLAPIGLGLVAWRKGWFTRTYR